MKIGLLHYSLPPVIGGVERVIAAHARLLRDKGHSPLLFCDGKQTVQASEFPFTIVPGFAGEDDFERRRTAVREFLASQNLDLIIAHNVITMPFSLSATAACHDLAATRLPVISWVHDLAAINPYYKIPTTEPANLLRRHPPGAHVVAVSEERANDYRLLTGFHDVLVIPNGIDPLTKTGERNFSQEIGLNQSFDTAFPLLFHPTRLLRRKNLSLGIRTVAALKDLGLHPRLLISGAPEPFSGGQTAYRAELDALVHELHLQHDVRFLGDAAPLSDSDISELYSMADALFFPSEHEGFGLPILEAGLRGLPIFASDSQPLSRLATAHGLTFSPYASPTSLACRIADFLATHAASQVRLAIRRDYLWQGIYTRHLAPLLQTFQK